MVALLDPRYTWATQQDYGAGNDTIYRAGWRWLAQRHGDDPHGLGGISWRVPASSMVDANGDLITSAAGRLIKPVTWVNESNTDFGFDHKVAIRVMFGTSTPAYVKNLLPSWMKWTDTSGNPDIIDAPHPCYTQAVASHTHPGNMTPHGHAVGEPNDIFLLWFEQKFWSQWVAFAEAHNVVIFLHGGWFGGQYSEIAYYPSVQPSGVGSGTAPYSAAQNREAHKRMMTIVHALTPPQYPVEWGMSGHGPITSLAGGGDFIRQLRLHGVSLYGGLSTGGRGRLTLSSNGWENTRIMGDFGASELRKQEDLLGVGTQNTTDANRLMVELQHIIGNPLADDVSNNYLWAYGSTVASPPAVRTLKDGAGRLIVGPLEPYLSQMVPTAQGGLAAAQPFYAEFDTAIPAFAAATAAEPALDDPPSLTVTKDLDVRWKVDPPANVYATPPASPFTADAQMSTTVSTVYGTIQIDVRYPTQSGSIAPGQFPLVLNGHGSEGTGPTVNGFDSHRQITRAGYVMAAPSMGPNQFMQNVNGRGPVIMSRVIDRLFELNADPGSVLYQKIHTARVGYIGTSMGAIIGYKMFDTAYDDPRIAAFVMKAGCASCLGASGHDWADVTTPILHIHGTSDGTVSIASGRAAYNAHQGQKGKIEVSGMGHDLAMTNPAYTGVMITAVRGFLRRYLFGLNDGISQVAAGVAASTNMTVGYVNTYENLGLTATKEATARWAVRAKVQDNATVRWAVRSRVQDSADARWALRSRAADQVSARWAVRAGVGAQADVRWEVIASSTEADLLLLESASLDGSGSVVETAPVTFPASATAGFVVAGAQRGSLPGGLPVTPTVEGGYETWTPVAVRSMPVDPPGSVWGGQAAIAGFLGSGALSNGEPVSVSYGAQAQEQIDLSVFAVTNGTLVGVLGQVVSVAGQTAEPVSTPAWETFDITVPSAAPSSILVSVGAAIAPDIGDYRDADWSIEHLHVAWESFGFLAMMVAKRSAGDADLTFSPAVGYVESPGGGIRAPYAGFMVELRSEPAALTATKEADVRWDVRAPVADTADARWAARSVIADTTDVRWRVGAIVADSVTARWTVRAPVVDDADVRWSVRSGAEAVTVDADVQWEVRVAVAALIDARWAVAAAVGRSADVRWQVEIDLVPLGYFFRAGLSDTIGTAGWGGGNGSTDDDDYYTSTPTFDPADVGALLAIGARAGSNPAAPSALAGGADGWTQIGSILNIGTVTSATLWKSTGALLNTQVHITFPAGVAACAAAVVAVQGCTPNIVQEVTGSPQVGQGAGSGATMTTEVTAPAVVTGDNDLFGFAFANNGSGFTAEASWAELVAADLATATPIINVGAASRSAGDGDLTFGGSGWGSLAFGGFVVEVERAAQVLNVAKQADLRWGVRGLLADTASLAWAVRALAEQAAADVRWAVQSVAGDDADLRWGVYAPVVDDADVRWELRAVTGDDAAVAWSVVGPVTADADVRWAVRRPLGIDIAALWEVRRALGAQADVRWSFVPDVAAAEAIILWQVIAAYHRAARDREVVAQRQRNVVVVRRRRR